MRKFFIIFVILCLAALSLSTKAKEAPYSSVAEEQAAAKDSLDLNIFTPGDLEVTINKALSLLWVIAVPVAVAMLLWSGIEFVSSAGDPKKVTAAKNRIKYTLIGLVVMILASSVVALVQNLLITK